MKNYINGILRLASVAALFYIIYNQRQQITELKQKNDNTKNVANLVTHKINQALYE